METSLKALAILIGSIFAAGALAALLLYQGIIRFNYPALEEFPVQGVDVSHHQKDIDWLRLKGVSAQFAYIKASEGATFRDPKFITNWNEALGAGVLPGAYHFFTLCKTGHEQAKNFLGALASIKGNGLPPAVDLEFGGNCGKRPTVEEFTAELKSFLDEIEKAVGCTPILYVTQEFYDAYVAGRFPQYRLWVRDIFRKPRLKEAEWQLWQFANRGRLPGVGTFIDLNVFKGSTAEFLTFRCGAVQQRAAADAMSPLRGSMSSLAALGAAEHER